MIKEFNSLKAILALMIFVHHLNFYSGGGSLAVALFFMLGGFLSTLGYKDRILHTDFNYRDYLVGKVIKFYPLHWVLLLFALPLAYYNTSYILKQTILLGLNASLLHSLIPMKNVYFSFNAVSWYLSDTIIFVAIFPYVLRCLLNFKTSLKIIAAIVAVFIYIVAWIYIPEQYVHPLFYINPLFRILDYLVGMVAALCFLNLKENKSLKENIARHRTPLFIIRIICFVLLVTISCLNKNLVLHSVVYMPIGCVYILLIAFVGGGILRYSILQKLGSISFAFFLVHDLVIRYLKLLFEYISFDNKVVLSLLAFIMTLSLSYVLTFYFDKNINLWLKKKINRQSMTARS